MTKRLFYGLVQTAVVMAAFTFTATPVHAGVLVNGDFSASLDDDGPDDITLQNFTGEWLNDQNSGPADWVIVDGAADLGNQGRSDARLPDRDCRFE